MMKTLTLGKIHYKIIALAITLCLVAVPAFADVTLEARVTVDDATLTVSCGEAFAGRNVVVQVFEPTGSLDNLMGSDGNYDVTDAEVIDNELCCIYQGKPDDSGNLTFTIAPTGPKGVYPVRISVRGLSAPVETEFVFSTDDDAMQVIEKLTDALTAAAVADVLKKDDTVSSNVYQSYQILNLEDNSYYTQYIDMDDSLKTLVCSNIAAILSASSEATPDGFVSLFEEAVVVESINVAEGEALLAYINDNAELLGIADRKEYTNIYNSTERFDDALKAEVTEAMENADFSLKSCEAVADTFCDILLTAIIPDGETAPGIINDFILEFEDALEDKGADIDKYKASAKPLDICLTIAAGAPYASLEDFAEKITDSAPASGTSSSTVEKPSKPSGGSTGISVSGGSSGGSSSVYVPVAKPVDKTEQAAFTDIADVAWAEEAISAMKAEGIIAGRGDGTFAPYDKVTREEFVKMLSVMLDLSADGIEAPGFSDVTGDEWFAPYVYAASANGIVNGIGDGFGVGAQITRQDMAVLCARAIDYKGAVLEAVRTDMAFTDAISDYAADAVDRLWRAGLVNGVSETEFAPLASATRAEAAKMLYEVLKAIR